MNPETNKFEQLIDQFQKPENTTTLELLNHIAQQQQSSSLLRPNGEPVPQHWTQFKIGEIITIKNYSFRVAYISETAILFKPVGPIVVGKQT